MYDHGNAAYNKESQMITTSANSGKLTALTAEQQSISQDFIKKQHKTSNREQVKTPETSEFNKNFHSSPNNNPLFARGIGPIEIIRFQRENVRDTIRVIDKQRDRIKDIQKQNRQTNDNVEKIKEGLDKISNKRR